jgi:hypothetical protein
VKPPARSRGCRVTFRASTLPCFPADGAAARIHLALSEYLAASRNDVFAPQVACSIHDDARWTPSRPERMPLSSSDAFDPPAADACTSTTCRQTAATTRSARSDAGWHTRSAVATSCLRVPAASSHGRPDAADRAERPFRLCSWRDACPGPFRRACSPCSPCWRPHAAHRPRGGASARSGKGGGGAAAAAASDAAPSRTAAVAAASPHAAGGGPDDACGAASAVIAPGAHSEPAHGRGARTHDAFVMAAEHATTRVSASSLGMLLFTTHGSVCEVRTIVSLYCSLRVDGTLCARRVHAETIVFVLGFWCEYLRLTRR